jgi:GAF domain-containing protein
MEGEMVLDADAVPGVAPEGLDRLTALAGRALGCSAFIVALGRSGEAELCSEFGLGAPCGPVAELPSLECLWLRTAEAAEALVIENAGEDPELRETEAVDSLSIGGCVGLPLVLRGRTIGALWLLVDHPRRWSDAEVRLAEDLSQLAAAEIGAALGAADAGDSVHLRARRAVIEALLGDGEEEKAMSALVEGLCRSLEWQAGSAWFSQPNRTTLVCGGVWFSGSIGLEAFGELYRSLRKEIDEDVLGQVWARQEPILADDLSDLRGFERASTARGAGFGAGLWLPVASRGRPLGVIELLAQEPRLGESEMSLVATSLGRQIGDLLALRGVARETRIRWPRLTRRLGPPVS